MNRTRGSGRRGVSARRSVTRLAIALGLLTGLAACSAPAASRSTGPGGDAELAMANVPRAAVSVPAAQTAAAGIDAFGFDLYRVVAGKGNSVVSPASIELALAMARAGARGDTAAQMDAVMHAFGADAGADGINSLDQALAGISGTFTDAGGTAHELTLRIANATFAQRGMPLQEAYLDALASRFGAGLRLTDYRTDPEAARQLINRWVDDQTAKRIPELLDRGTLDTMTRLVLVNAIYLKAPWQTPFSADSTAGAPFRRLDGSKVDVPTMNATLEARYGAGEGWRAVELPYGGGSLAMTIVVPDYLRAFEAGLDAAAFARIAASLETRQVQLAMPKFKLETKVDLARVLAAMGMPLAFDADRADFSGITAAERLYIAAVIHQANIDVDEKGTEAAAATAVVMAISTTAPDDPVTLRADRPFIFALRDTKTGAILFLGRVADPLPKG